MGKTFQLMRREESTLEGSPLTDGQKVLALTFMHGSRRRLDDRLRTLRGLRGRFSCMTIESLCLGTLYALAFSSSCPRACRNWPKTNTMQLAMRQGALMETEGVRNG